MRKYKGLYIDNVFYHNEEEIDEFLKEKAIESYKNALWLFTIQPGFDTSSYADKQAERLVNQFGFTWDEIETLEAETLAAM